MGLCVNHKRIERLMKLASLQGVSRRKGYVVTTQRDRQAKAADMTYVPTWLGFLYLAVVVDTKPRKNEIDGLQNLISAQQCRDSDSDSLLRRNNSHSLLAPKADPVVGAQGHEDGFKACFVPRDFLGQ